MKHRLHIDSRKYASKPTDAGALTNRICQKKARANLEKIADVVEQGQSLVFGTSFTSKRICKDFQQSTLVAIDMDNSLSPNELTKILSPSLMYYSFSHEVFGKPNSNTSDKPGWRYRAVWQLNTPIDDRDRYKKLVNALIKKCNSDGACKDSLRLYYGGKQGCVFHCDESNYLSDEIVNELVNLIPTVGRKPKCQIEKAYELEDLAQWQVKMLSRSLKRHKTLLLEPDKPRYEKAKRFFTHFMNMSFMSLELARYLFDEIVHADEELHHLYIIDWEEDKYEGVTENYANWCDKEYA